MHSPAFAELERLVRHLGEELASFRRRAFLAEARLRELDDEANAADPAAEEAKPRRGEEAQTLLAFDMGTEGGAPTAKDGKAAASEDEAVAGPAAPVDPLARIAELERENAALRERLAGATARTRQMLERVRFLRQQSQEASR